MTATAVAGLVAVMCFGVLAPRVAARLTPATATWLLGLSGITAAAITLAMLGLLAWTVLAQIPLVARVFHWSPQILQATDPVPRWLAAVSALLVAWSIGLALRSLATSMAGMLATHRASRGLAAAGSLIVLDDDQVDAFATSAGGRMVVTTGMLRALPAAERRALIAHEASHLAHRHAWWVMAANLASAVNPALIGTARAVSHAVERWADEDAAAAVGDRTLVARALARAALHAHTPMSPPPRRGPGALAGRVGDRVQALRGGPPRMQRLPALLLLALVVAGLVCLVSVQDDTDAFLARADTPSVVKVG